MATRSNDEGVKGFRWRAVIAVVAFLALLSALQIYLRQRAAGASPPVLWTVVTNLLAWVPWVLLTPVVFRLGRRFPLLTPRWWGSAALHLAAATTVAVGYLAFLALFWFLFFPEHTGSLDATTYLRVWGGALGELFLVAFVGYWLILMIGEVVDVWRRNRAVQADGPDAPEERDALQRLEIRSRGRVRYVDVDDVDWIEAAGSYVRVHAGDRSHLLRSTLAGLADGLGASFVRIHRSTVVRRERIVELRPRTHGEAMVRLSTGAELKVSRNYRKALEAMLG